MQFIIVHSFGCLYRACGRLWGSIWAFKIPVCEPSTPIGFFSTGMLLASLCIYVICVNEKPEIGLIPFFFACVLLVSVPLIEWKHRPKHRDIQNWVLFFTLDACPKIQRKIVYFMSVVLESLSPWDQSSFRIFFLSPKNQREGESTKRKEWKHINNTNRNGMPHRANCSKLVVGSFFSSLVFHVSFLHTVDVKSSLSRFGIYNFKLASHPCQC